MRAALAQAMREDPELAARLIVQTLPQTAERIEGPLAWDLTVRGLGSWRVRTGPPGAGPARVEVVDAAGSDVAFHLSTDAAGLIALATGGSPLALMLAGRIRIRGRRRDVARLRALAEPCELSIPACVRAGGAVDAEAIQRALPALVDPAWTAGRSLRIGWQVGAGEWFVHVRDGRPLHVTAVRPEQLDATLRMDADAYASFVAGESTWAEAIAEAGGAGLAVTLLGRWVERAFGRDELELAREERQRVIQTSRIGSWSAAAGGLHALYADWERERWSVHGLDFAADREQWLATPADAQADLLALIAPVVAGSERLAAGIASLWHVAPSGEAEVLLTTQLADLARAAALHDRFGAEVLALEAAGLRGRIRELNGAVPAAESGFRGFAEGVAECRALARAVSGKRRALLAVLESRGAYPGFARGLAWAERDGLRHEAIAAHFPAPAVPAPAHAPAAAALPC